MKLSVIVCTQNRAHAIISCLDSIAASLAHASPMDAEIVVVDNASEDDTSAVVRAWAKSCAFPVQLLFEPRKGLAVARNCALRTARGDLFAFTDDDCRMSEDYIADLLRHDAADTEPVLRGGRIELGDPADLPITINTRRTSNFWNRSMRSANREHLIGGVNGCNMAMRRTVFERLGPFDELFSSRSKIPAGEDTDYIYRAYLANMTIEYVPDMVIYHHHGRKSDFEGYQLMRNYNIGLGALYAKYLFKDPNLCRPFYRGLKNTFREMGAGKNTFHPEFGFSYKNMIAYNILGAIKYFFLSTINTKSKNFGNRDRLQHRPPGKE